MKAVLAVVAAGAMARACAEHHGLATPMKLATWLAMTERKNLGAAFQ